jgi:DNA-binding transcriptional regulator YhcF (GntR family)
MKKLSAVAIVTTAEGERVSYTYTELDSDGNITSQNNRASFVALDEGLLAAIKTLKDTVNARL